MWTIIGEKRRKKITELEDDKKIIELFEKIEYDSIMISRLETQKNLKKLSQGAFKFKNFP